MFLEVEEQKEKAEMHEKENKTTPSGLDNWNLLFIAAVIAIVAVTVYFRIPLLGFYGFYEPDGYFHYSVLRAGVNNNFSIPQWDRLSGSQVPGEPHHEPFGLYWVSMIPYIFLQFGGVGYYDIMRLMPVLFGIFDVIGAYFLARYLSKDKLLGLLVMLFIALNMGNAARTSALIYRGDTFVMPFLLVALIATVEIFRTEDKRKKLMMMGIVAFSLSVCNLVWNGAAFATAVYLFAFILMLILGFTFEKKKMVNDAKYMLGALFIWFFIVAFYRVMQWIVSVEAFTGWHFFMIYGMMVLSWFLIDDSMNGKKRLRLPYDGTPAGRFMLCMVAIIIAFIATYVMIPSFVEEIFVTSGFQAIGNFGSTIQELQAPTYQFLFASFGFQNFTNPMSIIMVISTYFNSNFIILFWLALLLCFIPYFFMHIEKDGKGIASGEARLRFHFDETLLLVISFYALTAYLQMHAIRFNSLLSVPISIVSAYTIYWIVCFFKRYKLAYYASYILVALLIIYMFQTDLNYITGLAPADQINSNFINAMLWLKNNSATNSVVLTLWPDGSVVEAVANLTSITDSVGSQYAYVANPFAAWLYNASSHPEFLLSNLSKKPDYLVVRSTWMYETGGIFTESGINVSSNQYGYNPFSGLKESVNDTTQVYQFFGSGLEEDTIITNSLGNQTIASYLKFDNGIQPFLYVNFYNQVTGDFSIIKQTAFNMTNNQTFLIVYSPVPAPNLYVNITAAYMLNTDLAKSNMIKFLFHCGTQICLWDNNLAKLELAFINTDTKIFRIVYNESNPAVAAAHYTRNFP
jgi:asparagine N-glycosylation enzyme membrane subunit Stt3